MCKLTFPTESGTEYYHYHTSAWMMLGAREGKAEFMVFSSAGKCLRAQNGAFPEGKEMSNNAKGKFLNGGKVKLLLAKT